MIYVRGIGAQSQPDSSVDNPFPLIATNAYLAAIHASPNAPAVSVVQVSNAFSLRPGAVARLRSDTPTPLGWQAEDFPC